MITIRQLSYDDCNETYVGWLNDPEVNRYLECRFQTHTLASLREYYIDSLRDSVLFGIMLGDEHIGNIKLGDINRHHKSADVGFFIGEKKMWGRGYATTAIKFATQYAFNCLGIYHIRAGVYGSNIGSRKALGNAGYAYSGLWARQLQGETSRDDHLWLTMTKEEYEAHSTDK